MTKLITFLTIIFGVFHLNAQLNGSYTIGGVLPSYATFNDAVNDLMLVGVTGPVVFNVRDGVYQEQVVIPSITGSSVLNTITFQSESLDSSLVRLEHNSTSIAENFVCKLNGAQHIAVRYMTLARDATDSEGCRTFILENGAHNNSLSHCQLIGKSNIEFTNHEVIYSPNTLDTTNYIGYNLITGGRYSFYLGGVSSSVCEPGTVIEHNKTVGSLTSFVSNYSEDLVVHNNVFEANVSINYFDGELRFSNNTVSGGVDIHYHQTVVNDSVIIVGNMIISPYQSAGIFVRDCPNVFIHHNSVYGNVNTNVSSGVLRVHSSNVRVANNIIHNTNGGFIVYLEYSSTIVSDYNIYYSTYRFIRRNGGTYVSLSSWQAGTLQDLSSYFSSTNFVSPTNLHITSDLYANGNGIDLGAADDLDGDLRPSNPDIGADEFQGPLNDAGVTGLPNINGYMCPGDQIIVANITNFGEDSLFSVSVGWSVNEVIQTPVSWTGAAGTNDTVVNILLGTHTFQPNGAYTIKAWTYSPNGATDTTNYNDTLYSPVTYTMLDGAYTVGGSTPDFSSLTACFDALLLRGVCGPVTFNIRSGDYNEVIDYDLSGVMGTSFVNNVVFQSEALNPDSVIHWYTANTFTYNWILRGYNWSHIYFKHITFTRTDSGSSDEIADFNNVYDIKFIDCIFNMNGYYGGTSLVFNSGSTVEIDSCKFNRMFAGLDATLDSNFVVRNSTFDNILTKSIRIYDCEDSTIIQNNLIFNDTINYPQLSGVTPQGINAAFCNKTVSVDKNQIFGRFSTGIMLTCLYDSLNPAQITNNFVSVGGSDWNGASGILLNGGYNVGFKHNSIRVYDPQWDNVTPNGVSGLQLGSNSHKNLTVINNLIQLDSTTYAFKLGADWSNLFLEFDHNNIYMTHPGFSQFVNALPTWPDVWNANTSYNNSLFNSLNDLHVINPQMALGVAVWTNVLDDIDQELREHPTVGADEGEFIPINTGAIMMDVVNVCDSADIYLKVFNYGLDTILKFDLGGLINGTNLPSLSWVGNLAPGDTTNWIFINRFEQIHGQVYDLYSYTVLPNDSLDYIADNDTSYQSYTGYNPVLDLGPDQTICAPDSLLLTYFPNASYSNLNWSTGDTTDTIFVLTSDIYYLTAENQFGCVKNDSIKVTIGGLQSPTLSSTTNEIISSESFGTNEWYLDSSLIAGESNDSLAYITFGTYFLINTDTLGCSVSSDSIIIENSRDAGVIHFELMNTCDSTEVFVDVKNYSTANLNSFNLYLEVDGNTMNTVSWNGTIPPGDTIFGISLGSFVHVFNQSMTVTAYTEAPNNLLDLYTTNDLKDTNLLLVQPVFTLGSDISICLGEITTLFPADSLLFTNFIWNTGVTTAAISTGDEDTFWLQANDEFGCARYDTINVIVGGVIDPVITQIGNTLYSSQNNGNQWYLNSISLTGETNDSLVPIFNGSYSLSYTDGIGCTTFSDTVNFTLGLDEINNAGSVLLYPVPATHAIHLRTNSVIKDLYITSANGQLVKGWTMEQNKDLTTINISALANGTYFIRLNNSTARFTVIK